MQPRSNLGGRIVAGYESLIERFGSMAQTYRSGTPNPFMRRMQLRFGTTQGPEASVKSPEPSAPSDLESKLLPGMVGSGTLSDPYTYVGGGITYSAVDPALIGTQTFPALSSTEGASLQPLAVLVRYSNREPNYIQLDLHKYDMWLRTNRS